MKRLTAIILTVMILLSSFTPVSATENPTTENKKIKWLLENNFIVGRGQTKDLKLEETITRAEFTRIVLASKGEENLAREASNLKSDFKDVPDSHWAEKFIAYAKEKGYISGYPDGNFIPEGKITYEEIISILARIHPQYKKIEANSTNWAEGFIKFAKDNGILDDINIVGSYKSPAIREKTFEMAYNFIIIADKTTKSGENSKTRETKEVKETKKENSIGNGFYPYWIDYGFRTSSEEKPEVKPSPDKPVKPGTENPVEPGTEPETPKEFDKANIKSITVKTQPTKLVYIEGDKLDLTGLEVKLTDNQNLEEEIGLSEFNAYGITTDPANGDVLKTDHNNTKIKIKLNGEEKTGTNLLTVKAKELVKISIDLNTTVPNGYTRITFDAGEGNTIDGTNRFKVIDVLTGTAWNNAKFTEQIPNSAVPTDKTKEFKGWNPEIPTTGNVETKTFTAEYKSKAKFIEVTDLESQAPEGYERLTFDATAAGKIDNAQVKALDVLKGTTYDDAELKAKIKEIVAVPTDKTKEFKGWNPEIPTTGNVETNEFTAEYKSKAKFIEVTDTESQAPEGYERLTFDATAAGKIDNAQVKALDVLKGTTYDDAELKAKIKEIVAFPTDKNKEFKGWDPEIPTGTEAVATKTYKAEYKEKVFDKNNITKIEVIAPPTKLTYVAEELLNLDGLKIKLTDNQNITKDVVFADFGTYNITTDPTKETKLTISENGKSIVISRGNTEVITGNISLKLKVISKADFDKEKKIKKSIKDSLVEVYKNLGDLKLGIDNLQNKYYLLFTKDANETTYDKKNLKTSIIATIKNNNIKSYTIGETKRDLTKSDDEILGFLREDILKLAELEGNPNATDVQILEKLKTTKPRIKIKLEFGDENISLDYEIIFLTQMAEEKLNQIEADFAKNMKDTSKIVDNENKGYRVSYNNKYYLVEHKNAIRDYGIVLLANDHRYDIVLTNFLTGEKLGESKSLKELKSFMVHTIRRNLDIDNRGIMDSMELQTLLGGGNYREITESYHETFRGSNNSGSIVGENLENSNISLEYFYADEVSGTGGIITRVIRYEHY